VRFCALAPKEDQGEGLPWYASFARRVVGHAKPDRPCSKRTEQGY